MCLIFDRIQMIKENTNPWFVKELETGYVVIGDYQHFKGYTLFLCKEHKTELYQLDQRVDMYNTDYGNGVALTVNGMSIHIVRTQRLYMDFPIEIILVIVGYLISSYIEYS